MTRDSYGLVTTRNENQTLWLLFTAILGSVFGIMSTIGVIMKCFESKWIAITKKEKIKTVYDLTLENTFKISQSLDPHIFWKTEESKIESEISGE